MEQSPLSLYIELEKGQRADLEVIARAALAFATAVKEVSYVLDPSLEVRIEFASGTEGSISLNSIIRAIRENSKPDEITIKAVVIIIILWFGKETAIWAFDKVMDEIFGHQEITQHLSQEDVDKIAATVTVSLEKRLGSQPVQQVYRELEKDEAIRGVGASVMLGQRPAIIVPREQFPSRSGAGFELRTSEERRQTTREERVTLISPVLLAGKRRWRFSFREGEFGAPIKDTLFVERLLAGQIAVPMTAGIEMDVMLQTIQERRDGVWVILERNILQVIKIYPRLTQQALSFPLGSPVKRNHKDE